MNRKVKNNSTKIFTKSIVFSSIILLVVTSFFTARYVLGKREGLNVNKQSELKVLAANDTQKTENKNFAKLPTLEKDVEFPIISARSVMAIDLDSGISLYEKDPDIDSLPASTTKIMTAIVAMEHFDPAQEIVIEQNKIVGQKMDLVIGETIIVDNLIKGLLIRSANDAAEVLARNYEDGRGSFVDKMNEKVVKLRLTDTFFKNPSGLDEAGQTTTARDLMKLATYAMQKPHFAEIVGTKTLDVQSTDGKYSHRLTNTNELLGKVEGVLGTKTGWTENARENLVTYIERGEKKVIIVLLGSQDRFGETEELIEWIFRSYNWGEVDLGV